MSLQGSVSVCYTAPIGYTIPPVINPRWWLDHLGGTKGKAEKLRELRPKMQWNMVKLQGSPVWHCSLSWHWSRWTWRSALWLSALLPQSWFACRKIRPDFSIVASTYSALTHVDAQLTKWLLGKDYISNCYLTYSPLLLQVCFVPD